MENFSPKKHWEKNKHYSIELGSSFLSLLKTDNTLKNSFDPILFKDKNNVSNPTVQFFKCLLFLLKKINFI